MRIGIDVRELKKSSHTGLGTILENLFEFLPEIKDVEYVLISNQFVDKTLLPEGVEIVVINEGDVFIWDQIKLPRVLRQRRIDVYYTPYIKTPFVRVCTYVNTVSDVIPLLVPKCNKVKGFFEKIYFVFYSIISSSRSVKVITISEYTKNNISRMFWIPKSKIEVIYPSINAEKLTSGRLSENKMDKPYVLYIGNFKPHKNVERLIRGFDLLPEDVKHNYKLVLAGGSNKDISRVNNVIEKLKLSENIEVLPQITEEEKRTLLKNASIFAFPSLTEGFGIPPVEAMAFGVPVVASNIGPIPEVLAGAALYFNPYDPKDISRTLLKIINDKVLQDRYKLKAQERVKLFSPSMMAKKIIDSLVDTQTKKTLLTTCEFPPMIGGIATMIFNLWSRLPKEKACVLTRNNDWKIIYPEVDLNVLPCIYPQGANPVSRIIRTVLVAWHIFKVNSARHIKCNHCANLMSTGLGGLIVKKLKKIPFVLYVYAADVLEFTNGFFTKQLAKKIFKEAEHIITISNFTKDIILKKDLKSEREITIINPGVDTERFSPGRGSSILKEKYNITPEKKVLLTVARLAQRKGHEVVLRALAGVIERVPDVIYVVVGEGPKKSYLEKLVQDLKLFRNVIFAGEIDDDELPFYYNLCDVFVMLPQHIKEKSDVEGFGIVYLEANACGKPVIAGNTGGVTEAVIDGETGIVVNPQDMDEVKKAILKLLEDEEYARSLGNKGMARAQKDFNWQDKANELSNFL